MTTVDLLYEDVGIVRRVDILSPTAPFAADLDAIFSGIYLPDPACMGSDAARIAVANHISWSEGAWSDGNAVLVNDLIDVIGTVNPLTSR